jgi:hypothetical protein
MAASRSVIKSCRTSVLPALHPDPCFSVSGLLTKKVIEKAELPLSENKIFSGATKIDSRRLSIVGICRFWSRMP